MVGREEGSSVHCDIQTYVVGGGGIVAEFETY
jgi:hypothetical protein